jgi:membrane protein DedA with SNARE-associated domain
VSLAELIEQYGYAAVAIGCFVEGETMLLLAGLAVHRDHLSLAGTILAAFLGSIAGGLLFFAIGRRRGEAFLARRPRWSARAARVRERMRGRETALILGFRFVPGIRTVTPLVLGTSGVSSARFALLDAASATVWASAGVGLGYGAGDAFELVLGDLRRHEPALFAGIAALGAAVWLWRRKAPAAPRSEP